MKDKRKAVIKMIEVKADRILKGGTFFSGKQKEDDWDFIAVKDNKILAMGNSEEMETFVGADTKIHQFTKEQLIMPGIHDNHIHLIQAGLLEKYADLFDAKSEAEAIETARNFAEANPDEKWVLGFGWSKYAFGELPTKESIDAVISDRPVMLLDDELHSAWVNSAALKEAEITNETPDPPFGEIKRDRDGEATGFLYEHALSLVAKLAFDFDMDCVKDLINRYSKRAVAFGITSVTDMAPYLGINLAYEDAYFDMVEKDELRIRVNTARDLFEDIDHVVRLREKAENVGKGMYRIPFLKQFIDGIPGTHTAYLLEDYSDKPGDRGGLLLDADKMRAAIKDAHQRGLSVRLHACGDAAVKLGLDGYEEAITQFGKMECRHQIEHIEVIEPSDIERFARLGVIASVQPEHIVSGMASYSKNDYPQLLGEKRTRYTWVLQTLIDSGAMLAGGSDCPVVKGNPFMGMYCGMERLHEDGTPEGGWNPDEKIKIFDLLRMYTYHAAYGEGREDELGTLEPGKLADIIVVDRNLMTETSERIRDAEVLLTMVNGKIVYEEELS